MSSPAARSAFPDRLPISPEQLADLRAAYDAGARRVIAFFSSKRDFLETAPRRRDLDGIYAEADAMFGPGLETPTERVRRELLDAALARDHLATLRVLAEMSRLDPAQHAEYVQALRDGVTAAMTAGSDHASTPSSADTTSDRERGDNEAIWGVPQLREITAAAELDELPDWSVVVEVESDDIGVSIKLHRTYGRDRWTELDPGDRDDGDFSWTAEDVFVLARNQGHRIFVGYVGGTKLSLGPLSIAELDAMPPGSAVIAIPREERRRRGTVVYEKRSERRWTNMDPADRDDGDAFVDSSAIYHWANREDADPFVLFDPRWVG